MNDSNPQMGRDYIEIKRDTIGGETYFIAESNNDKFLNKYITGTVTLIDIIFQESFKTEFTNNDFVKVATHYYNCLLEKAKTLDIELGKEPIGIIKGNDCENIRCYKSIEGKVVALNSKELYPEYQKSAHQVYLAIGGFGCNPNGRGSAVFAINLYNGEEVRLEQNSLLGVIKKNRIPEWANKKLKELNYSKTKENKGVER